MIHQIRYKSCLLGVASFIFICKKLNLSLFSPYHAEACNEFAVPISAT